MGSTTSVLPLPTTGLTTSEKAFPTILHAYYALGRALLRGDPQTRRPPIPIELVLQIFQRISRKNPSPSLTVHSSGVCVVYSISPHVEELFFHSEPVNRRFLNQVVKMELHTVSKDQGWVGDPNAGSWTWFEIGILRPLGDIGPEIGTNTVNLEFQDPRAATSYTPVISDGTGEVLRWMSHSNIIASKDYHALRGAIFGPDHEIWRNLQEGDVICVYACARFGGWKNDAKSGRLMFWESFDPMTLPYIPE